MDNLPCAQFERFPHITLHILLNTDQHDISPIELSIIIRDYSVSIICCQEQHVMVNNA